MVVLVVSRIRQAIIRSRLYSGVVGDSMLVRLRNSTIALLGTVTIVGLVLVAFISQLDFPGVFNGPIPDGSRSGSAAVSGAIAIAPGRPVGHRALRGRRASARVRSSSLDASRPAVSTGLGSSHQARHGPAEQPPSVKVQPPSVHVQPPSPPAPVPAVEPETPPPAPSKGVPGVPESESSGQHEKVSPVKSHSKTEDHSEDRAKGKSEARPGPSSSRGSQSHHPSKSKGHPGPPPKPTSGPPGKRDKADSPSSKPPNLPAPPAPVEKKPAGAGGKETGHAGKSDESHH